MKRPKSACSVRPRRPFRSPRPRSSLGLRSIKECESEPDINREATPVGRYHRCLRLLGLTNEDSGHIEDKSSNIKNVQPRVKTFVARRTVSHEDVRDAVLKEMERSVSGDDEFHNDTTARKILAKAVYEEWYFNKLDSTKQHEKLKRQENKEQQWQQVRVKQERYQKSQEKFMEWIRSKNEQMRKHRRQQNKNVQSGSGTRLELPYNIWKEQKDKLIKNMTTEETAHKRQQEEERSKLEIRRTEAQKAFETWKRMADEKCKKKSQNEERKRKEEKEKAMVDQEEKQKNANAAFECWKRNKDSRCRKQIKEAREKEREITIARRELFENRRRTAQEAFLQWLDSLDN